MPNIQVALGNLTSSVERPIIFDVIAQLKKHTGLGENVPVRYYGDESIAPQQESTIAGSIQGHGNPGALNENGQSQNRFGQSEQIQIEVSKQVDPNNILTMAIKQRENPPVFDEPALGIYIAPIYSVTNITISIRYRGQDKNQVERWKNDYLQRTALLRDVVLHQLGYHYTFPQEYIVILEKIHEMREAQAGYGDTFADWFANHLSPKATVIVDSAGKNPLLVVREKQGRILGYFEFEGYPSESERQSDQSAWVATCNYRFSYNLPVGMHMRYPNIIHNQLLPADFRVTEKVYQPIDTESSLTVSGDAFAEFEDESRSIRHRADDGLIIPNFDFFIPATISPSSVRVFSALTTITPADRRTLMNLKDLGDYSFREELLEFFKVERQYMPKWFKSIFCLDLYEGRQIQPHPSLIVTENLDVIANRDLDLRKIYRVRLGMYTDFHYPNKEALARLKEHFEAAALIAKAIDGSISNKGGHQDIKKNRLYPEEYLKIGLKPDGSYEQYIGRDGGLNPALGHDMNTIRWGLQQVLFIQTRSLRIFNPAKPDTYVGSTR